jgi:hypothetical protein
VHEVPTNDLRIVVASAAVVTVCARSVAGAVARNHFPNLPTVLADQAASRGRARPGSM